MIGDYHQSVLLNEVLKILEGVGIRGKWFLDATLGDGGYALEILQKGGKVIGVDVDPQALERSKHRFEEEKIAPDRYRLLQGNFARINNLIQQTDTEDLKFAGAILDLGVSSLQLEVPERGFSFSKNGPLDMRMDPTLQVAALDLINGLNKGELYELFNKLGEEQLAKALADAVVGARGIRKIETTTQLADLVTGVYRRFGLFRPKIPARLATRSVAGRHPATKVFQALRIAVNDELNALKEGLPQILGKIEKNGVILVTCFHSLEDRIVKTTFIKWQDNGFGQVLTNKPIVPSEEEIIRNPRSRSAKLRVFKKT